jgi:hypothetical protein
MFFNAIGLVQQRIPRMILHELIIANPFVSRHGSCVTTCKRNLVLAKKDTLLSSIIKYFSKQPKGTTRRKFAFVDIFERWCLLLLVLCVTHRTQGMASPLAMKTKYTSIAYI